jgi:tellurite resistance protein TerC
MLFSRNDKEEMNTEKHPVVRFASKIFKVKSDRPGRFFINENKKFYITPLFIVLLIVEFSDVVFAVDSIPAIFSVTRDTYIVFFSNVFAIIGLRSLFFLVIHVVKLFRFLGYAISALLVFIGLKILLHSYTEAWGFTTVHSLIVVFSIIAMGILISVIIPEKKKIQDL